MWENLSEHHTKLEPDQGAGLGPQTRFNFTVMSYNILAQDLLEANIELYQHCTPEVLAWEFRFQNILREFVKWEPDVSGTLPTLTSTPCDNVSLKYKDLSHKSCPKLCIYLWHYYLLVNHS